MVIHFAISYRPTRGSMLPYNTAGLISEDSEEVAAQIAKNCRRRQPMDPVNRPNLKSVALPIPEIIADFGQSLDLR